MSGSIHLRVVSPEKTVFEGEATSLVVPAWDGKVGILPGHAPVISLLGAGELAIDRRDAESVTFYVERGVFKVEGDRAVVLTERAEPEMPAEGLPRDALVHPEELEILESAAPWNPLT